ncbi:putative disease resistance protein RGA4 [Spatholobus suberectus]|nr:putative disease resistance protein RGA4 [Spatholobus suberectus]
MANHESYLGTLKKAKASQGPHFDKAKKLRSILFFTKTLSRPSLRVYMSSRVLEDIFKSFKRVCVLDLYDLGIMAVLNSIGELKDLEYLDLSQNEMEKLPRSITKLSKLKTLKLYHCYKLKELPKDFNNLGELKHLDMEGFLGSLLHAERDKQADLCIDIVCFCG